MARPFWVREDLATEDYIEGEVYGSVATILGHGHTTATVL